MTKLLVKTQTKAIAGVTILERLPNFDAIKQAYATGQISFDDACAATGWSQATNELVLGKYHATTTRTTNTERE